ncbi:uncharacterized protein VNE69_03041 [Vairimorpha necatrix]|uniref:Uncharacterized protein n=1 Tax=Vairimorpha necatrix TaxID=6039 RepID=A0AAX4JA47_9MICR
MVDKLIEKFKKLDELYEQKKDLLLQAQHAKNHKFLKQVINDKFKLRDFLKNHNLSKEDHLKIENLIKKDFLEFNNIKEIYCKLDILKLVNCQNLNSLILELFDSIYANIKNLKITEKIMVLNSLRNLDNNKIDELCEKEINLFFEKTDLDPVNLNIWICNLLDVSLFVKNKQTLLYKKIKEEYKKHEILYFKLSINLLNLQEDLDSLNLKIKERSKLFHVDLSEELRRVQISSGFLVKEVNEK